VGGLVRREEHGLGRVDTAFGDLVSVDEEGGGAALAQAAAIVGELDTDLMPARRNWLLADGLEALQSEKVVAVGGTAIRGEVEAPTTEGSTLRDDDTGRALLWHDDLGGDGVGLVLEGDHGALTQSPHSGVQHLRVSAHELRPASQI